MDFLLSLPSNVNRYGGDSEHITLPTLKAGESHTFEYELIANQEAAEMLDIKIDLAEKEGRFAQDANIPLQFGQHIGGSIAMNVERRDQEVEIKRVLSFQVPVSNPERVDLMLSQTFLCPSTVIMGSLVSLRPTSLKPMETVGMWCIRPAEFSRLVLLQLI